MNAARIDAMPESSVGTQWSSRLSGEIGKAVLGQVQIVERLQIALLTGGHVLLEGMPGLAKTLLVKSLARALGVEFERIQFTPDLLPADITGTYVLSPRDGTFSLRAGPIFANVVLADEINRAPAKTQSALLEVMQEYQVTLEGQTLAVPQPFMVLATQNPVETEGTYPLPEAQLDRFLFKVEIGYPPADVEVDVVVRATDGQAGNDLPLAAVSPCLDGAAVLQLQKVAAFQRVDRQVIDYAVRLARATREYPGLAVGASSRGALALVRGGRAVALLDGRDYVTPDDVKRIALPALRHRVALAPDALLEGRTANDLLAEVIETVAAPRA